VVKDWVKITWSIGAISALHDFNMCVGIPSGPEALLVSNYWSRFSIPSVENIMWSQVGYIEVSKFGVPLSLSVKNV